MEGEGSRISCRTDARSAWYSAMRTVAIVALTLIARTAAAQGWDMRAAAAYLDSRQTWWSAWPTAARDHETACVSCHAVTNGGKLNVAGTVFPKLHEPDSCLGVAGGVQVIITDAQGNDHTLAVNTSGNFYDNSLFGFQTPYKAKVVSASGSIAKISTQTNGDCNACHTTAGTQGAAGRLVGP